MAFTKPRAILQRGTRADQPAAADVAEGALYFVTDEGVTERSTGSAWETWSGLIMQDWTPTFTDLTIGNGTYTAKWADAGDLVYWEFAFTLGSTSAVGSAPRLTLPKEPSAVIGVQFLGFAFAGQVSSGANYPGIVQYLGTTPATGLFRADGQPVVTWSSTNPFTWTTSDQMFANGWYTPTGVY